MEKYIEVSEDLRTKLMKIFNCSKMTIWRALFYKQDNGNNPKIRHYALNNGGVLMVKAPACETIHTHDHRMIQTFPNEVILNIHMPTGECKVTHKGKELRTLTLVTIPELEQLQAEVAAL